MTPKSILSISFLLFFLFSICASAQLNTYIVPAISDTKILPTSTISDSLVGSNLSCRISPGQYQALSFAMKSDSEIDGLNISCSNLSGVNGTIPSSAVDLKWVKCWWQGGYDMDIFISGRYLTPELLLNDDKLVNVTYENWTRADISNPSGKNYLKLSNGTYLDISNSDNLTGTSDIPNSDRPFQDASTLQSINLSSNYNKQVWVTVHPGNVSSGNYTGYISIFNSNGNVSRLNISVQILNYNLPPDNIEYSIYYHSGLYGNGTLSSDSKNEQQYTSEMYDMKNHGITNPIMYNWISNASLISEMNVSKTVGMNNTNFYHWVPNGQTVDSNYVTGYKNLLAPYNVTNWYEYGPDETNLNTTQYRNRITNEHSIGAKHFGSQSIDQASQIADLLDIAVVSSTPSKTLSSTYHSYGNKIYSYANPQTIPEYPRTFRLNYGLLLWQQDYDGAMDFAYQLGFGDIWNDFDHVSLRDHVFAYPTPTGVIDTVQWEGFREGSTDVKYLTELTNLINSGDPADTTVIEAQNYITNLKADDLSTADLDSIRYQMISYIDSISNNCHKLNINKGAGSGDYPLNTRINISANIVQNGTIFTNWIGDTQFISNVNSTETVVSMPGHQVNLTAVYSSKWTDINYTTRSQFAIDHSDVLNSDQSDFPVLINVTNNSLKFESNGGYVKNQNGYDILFVLPDGTKLDTETEYYNGSTGNITARVLFPVVSHTSDTIFYMYIGNSNITSSQANPKSTWKNNYSLVAHLDESGNGSIGDYKDSSPDSYNSTNTISQPLLTSGKIGGAQYFDGTGPKITFGHGGGFNFNDSFTLSGWIKPTSFSRDLINKWGASGGKSFATYIDAGVQYSVRVPMLLDQ